MVEWLKIFKKGFSNNNKKEIKDLWVKCEKCGEILYKDKLKSNNYVCQHCGYHFRIKAIDYINTLCDAQSFVEKDTNIKSEDFLSFKDKKKYSDRIKDYMHKTGQNEAVRIGEGEIDGNKVELAVMDFSFLGGSMGSAVGEKISRAIKYAIENKRPLIIVSASGGARMQESIFSLMQMAKTSAYLAKLSEAKIPFISILTHPTYGGITASFASLGDVIVAEPNALIGFAGPRVIKETIKQDLPEGFQTSEFQLEHGFVDIISPRNELKSTVSKLIKHLYYK